MKAGAGEGTCNSTLFTMRHWLADGQAGRQGLFKITNLRHAAKMSALLRIQYCSLLDIQVFRICNIFARIRIRGSVPYGLTDPDPALFVSDLQDTNKKYCFSFKVFGLLLFEGKFTSFFEDKSHKEETVGINVFLTIFA